ncbi:MAG: hypothetical protein JRJ85_21325 [Deltaproteobacteria bacterium]|nr:hypothetical protein [Deltaproteobacteria bacterium]
MIDSVSSSISALNAHGKKMGVTANNVANVSSEGFKKSRAVLEEGTMSHVEVEISRVDTPGPLVTEVIDGERVERELSNVDLAEELTLTIPTQRGYEANLAMIRTEDEMLGSIIDIIL